MGEVIRYKGALTLIGLQTKMRNDEALELRLTAIDEDGSDTIVSYEDGSVASRSLQLFLDPGSNLEPPAGSVLICRGMARITGSAQKIAVFRKG